MKLKTKKNLLGVLFILPAFAGVLIFSYYPVGKAIFMSLFDYDIIHPPGKFIGIDNFKSLFNKQLYWLAWANTLILFFYSMLFGFWVPIFQAIFLSIISTMQRIFRFLYIFPAVIPGVAMLTMWRWVFNPDFGVLNSILGVFGLGPYQWIYDPDTSKLSMGLMGLLGGGFGVLIYLANIQNISREQFEAAEIDGATGWKKITRIIIPHMKSITLIQLIFSVIGGLQAFNTPFIMTDGGPINSTMVLNILTYRAAFQDYNFGYASAIVLSMFVLIFVLTRIQIRVQSRLEE